MPAHPMVKEDKPITVQPEILQVRVERTYPDRFMVDVSAVYGRRYFDGVAIASPYLHPDGGAGVTVFPKEGALGILVIPSDGSPPVLAHFIAPYRPPQGTTPGDAANQGIPLPKQEQLSLGSKGAARFDGNRETGVRGDQNWLGAEGQGMRILEGGLMEVGARPLCNTVYESMGHRRDVCRQSESMWPGGYASCQRRVVSGQQLYQSTWVHRLKDTEEYGSLRMRAGGKLLQEPDKQETSLVPAAAEAGVDLDEGVMELHLSPDRFDTVNGEPLPKARNESRFRALLTRAGSLCLRMLQSFVLKAAKIVRIEALEGMILKGRTVALQGVEGVSIGSEKGQVSIQGSVVKIAGGQRGVIAQGDIITFTIPPGTLLVGQLTPPTPAGQVYTATFASPSLSISGVITSPGSANVKVP